jgi:hypothetical protein
VNVQDTTSLLAEEPEPVEGHWTRAVSGIGMGKKLKEIAMRDDAVSTHLFKSFRRENGLFLLQQHATGVVNDSRPYDVSRDGLHLVVSSAPVVYLDREVSRMVKKHGRKKVHKIFGESIENGDDNGSPAAEYYFGAKPGKFWDPKGLVLQEYKRALQSVPGFENANSLQTIMKRLNEAIMK